jgi:phosphoserine aminotransferase
MTHAIPRSPLSQHGRSVKRMRNFSGGPGAHSRASVLLEAQQAVVSLPGTGVSILGLSHRSRLFREMLDEAEERLRTVARRAAKLRGLVPAGGRDAPVLDGAHDDAAARRCGRLRGERLLEPEGRRGGSSPRGRRRCLEWVVAMASADCPIQGSLWGAAEASYVHYVSNETVEGLQFRWVPRASAPLVCDASSDLLSKPLDASPLSLVYAHAQKNVGPAGVTLVLVRDEVLERRPSWARTLLGLRRPRAGRVAPPHAAGLRDLRRLALVALARVTRWGDSRRWGRSMRRRRASFAASSSGSLPFYRREVRPGFESDMNVTFRCPTAELDARFEARATQAGLLGTEGHRSRGGLRISLYNGVTIEDARGRHRASFPSLPMSTGTLSMRLRLRDFHARTRTGARRAR